MWEHIINGPLLELAVNPCGDCAVTCGFYLPESNELKKESEIIQREVSKRWFCHNDSSKACRGNWENLNLKDATQQALAHAREIAKGGSK